MSSQDTNPAHSPTSHGPANIWSGQGFQGSLTSQRFAGSGYEERHAQLGRDFDTSPDHGKDIDLNTYSVHDCASVLLDYIATIPELLGRARVTRKPKGLRLRSEKEFAVLLATLAEPNLELLMVTIAFFAAYAEIGRAHASLAKTSNPSYHDLIRKLAELFHTIIVGPLEPSDRSSIQTLELVLKTPVRFRSIVMLERSKRAQSRYQRPSQPLFQIQVGASVNGKSDQDESETQSWSRCATEGDEVEQYTNPPDKETCSSDEMSVENFDSEWFDAIEGEQVPSEVQVDQVEDSVDIPTEIEHLTQDHTSETTVDRPQHKSRFHESRLIRRRDTTEETLAIIPTCTTLVDAESPELEVSEEFEPFRPELWGLSVSDTVGIAGHFMDCTSFTLHGDGIPFSGRVPIVVAKCIEKVLCTSSAAGQCKSGLGPRTRFPANAK